MNKSVLETAMGPQVLLLVRSSQTCMRGPGVGDTFTGEIVQEEVKEIYCDVKFLKFGSNIDTSSGTGPCAEQHDVITGLAAVCEVAFLCITHLPSISLSDMQASITVWVKHSSRGSHPRWRTS